MNINTGYVDTAIGGLFDSHGPEAIIEALAKRCQDEAAIAQGEGRPNHKWLHLAERLREIKEDE